MRMLTVVRQQSMLGLYLLQRMRWIRTRLANVQHGARHQMLLNRPRTGFITLDWL